MPRRQDKPHHPVEKEKASPRQKKGRGNHHRDTACSQDLVVSPGESGELDAAERNFVAAVQPDELLACVDFWSEDNRDLGGREGAHH
jgi:hypothetical protein